MSDYDARRRAMSKRGYRTVAESKTERVVCNFRCPNIDCRHGWTEYCEPEKAVGVCSRCGMKGIRT